MIRLGRVPVAVVALHDPGCDASALLQWFQHWLVAYKLPKEIRFIAETEFPRSSTGKIQRHETERILL